MSGVSKGIGCWCTVLLKHGKADAAMRAGNGAVDMTGKDMAHPAMPLDGCIESVLIAKTDRIHAGKAGFMRRMVKKKQHRATIRLRQASFEKGKPRRAEKACMVMRVAIGRKRDGIENDQSAIGKVDDGLHEPVLVARGVAEDVLENRALVVVADGDGERRHQPSSSVFRRR